MDRGRHWADIESTALRGGRRGYGHRGKGFKVISIASGKGGVGKTLTTVNLATAAQSMGYRVLILDGDFGLANVDVVLGLQGRYNINDVLEEKAELKDIILTGPLGIRVIPSGSGFTKLTQLSFVQRLQILEQIEQLEEPFDVLLIDTGAGISNTVLHLNSMADEVVVITTPEPHAMTDAYAFIKVMTEEHGEKPINLAVNMVRSEEEGLKVSTRIADVARRFIGVELRVLGNIPLDPQMQKSVMMRRAASEQSTYTIAGQACNGIARSLFQGISVVHDKAEERKFWRELMLSRVPGEPVAPAFS